MTELEVMLSVSSNGSEPLIEKVKITGGDPFVAGVQLVDWLRKHADSLERAMAQDAGSNV